jgi:HptB-dependent secretion and biofilm anti anti-sigma factor
MKIQTYADNNKTIVHIPSEFNFKIQKQFREFYEAQPRDRIFVVDFSQVEIIDSSALGMLLLFRIYAGEEQSNISIINCSTQVRKLFEVVHFLDIFRID